MSQLNELQRRVLQMLYLLSDGEPDTLPATVERALGWHEDPATLDPQQIAALLRGGDVVVVKGSKKMFWVNKFVPRLLAALQAKA